LGSYMTGEFHIFTVGAAILLNYARSKGDQNLINVIKSDPLSDDQRRIESKAHRGDSLFEDVLGYVKVNPTRASAELNAFHKFESKKGTLKEDVLINLYSTDTGVGWFCSMILYHYLRDGGYMVNEPVRVRGFGAGAIIFEEGLFNLLSLFSKVIRSKKKEGAKVYINATGGFKPESAMAVMSAFLFGADAAYYIHEAFRDIVVLYPFPMRLDYDLLRELKKCDGVQVSSFQGIMIGDRFYSLEDLRVRGLVRVKDGLVRVRRWVSVLMEE